MHGDLLQPPRFLEREQAAAHCGFVIATYNLWLKRGLLPEPDSDTGGWSPEALDEALDRLARFGFEPSITANAKRGGYFKLPNVHRSPRTYNEITRVHYYRRRMRGALPGKPGSREFLTALIAKERELASRQLVKVSPRSQQTPESAATNSHVPAKEPDPRRQAQNRACAVSPISSTERMLSNDDETYQLNRGTPMPDNKFLTPEEVSERYRGEITVGTLRNWRAMRVGPPYLKLGKAVLYPVEELDAWDRQNLVTTRDAAKSHRMHEREGA